MAFSDILSYAAPETMAASCKYNCLNMSYKYEKHEQTYFWNFEPGNMPDHAHIRNPSANPLIGFFRISAGKSANIKHKVNKFQ